MKERVVEVDLFVNETLINDFFFFYCIPDYRTLTPTLPLINRVQNIGILLL
jgi:hypothetical protein